MGDFLSDTTTWKASGGFHLANIYDVHLNRSKGVPNLKDMDANVIH